MPPRKKKEPEPLTEAPSRSRGYYATPLGRFRSVTTILEGGYPKDALVPWAGRMAAECAVDNIPWLASLRGSVARQEAVDWIKLAADRYKKETAALGTAVHDYLEGRALGSPTAEPTEAQAPYFAAVDDFLDTMTPEWEASELVVANPDEGYAGTLDGILRFPRHRVTYPGISIIDGKSGRSAWGEVGMQLGAYKRARVGWLRDGTQVEPPVSDHGYVLHIRPGDDPKRETYPGGWALIPVDTSDAVHAVFQHVMAVSAAKNQIKNKVLGDPRTDTTPDTTPDDNSGKAA